MNDALRRRVLGLLGLGLRSRGAIVGVEQVRDAARRGKVEFVAVAHDVSKHSLDKLVPLLEARRIRYLMDLSAAELGALAGRTTTAAIGVTDRNLARGLRDLVAPRAQGT